MLLSWDARGDERPALHLHGAESCRGSRLLFAILWPELTLIPLTFVRSKVLELKALPWFFHGPLPKSREDTGRNSGMLNKDMKELLDGNDRTVALGLQPHKPLDLFYSRTLLSTT